MKLKRNALRSGWCLAALVGLVLATACSSKSATDDEIVEEPEPEQIEIISQDTGIPEAALEAFQEGVHHLTAGEYSQAAERFEFAIDEEPTFAEAHYNLGLLYGDMDQAERAVEHIQQARELDPEIFDYTVAMAKAYAEAEDYDNARRLFEEVVGRQPDNLTAKNNLAVIALREGNEEEALRYVEEILREDNDDVGALSTLGLIYMQRENISLAKYALGRALDEDEENVDVLNNLGLVYMQEDDVPTAVRHFTKAIEVDPNYLEARLNLGSILIEYLDYEWAHEQFDNAVRIAPENCVANLGKGATSFAQRQYEDSHGFYEFYLERCDGDHISSYERLVELNQNYLRRPAKAIEYYRELLERETDEEKLRQYEAEINFLQNQIDRQAEQGSDDDGGEEEVVEDDASTEDEPSEE